MKNLNCQNRYQDFWDALLGTQEDIPVTSSEGVARGCTIIGAARLGIAREVETHFVCHHPSQSFAHPFVPASGQVPVDREKKWSG